MSRPDPSSILVVDDHRPTRQSLCLLLRDVGYACCAAGSAADARVALGPRAVTIPSLVIVDLWMPHEDGEALLRWIREQRHLEGTKVVIYSAAPEGDHAGRLIEAGAAAFWTKPMAIRRLLEEVAGFAVASRVGMQAVSSQLPVPSSQF